MKLTDLFKLEKISENTYKYKKYEFNESVISIGFIVSQAIAVAVKTVPPHMMLINYHTYFCGKVTNPSALVYHVKDLCTKDELCVREVEILQNDELRIKSHILFHEICREFIAHQCHMPVTPMPDFCDSLTETLKQLLERHNDEVFSLSHETDELGNMILLDPINEIFDICIVDADSFRAATMKGFFTKIWAKTKTKFEGSSSDHKLLASYLIETTFLPSMLRYHISRGFSLTELIPLNFCLYIHSNDINVNEWFLCDNHFSIAKCGRAFIEHHLWTVTGNLLITASSEAIIKGRFVVSNT